MGPLTPVPGIHYARTSVPPVAQRAGAAASEREGWGL